MEAFAIQKTITSSKPALWTSRIVSGIIILFLLLDSIMKIIMEHHYVDGTRQAGFSVTLVQPIGFALLIITILYIIPLTSIIGAVLLTAYLGGAVAIMIQQGQSFLFPIIFCILAWVSLYFRSARLRSLFNN
jgi:hypothetical protein